MKRQNIILAGLGEFLALAMLLLSLPAHAQMPRTAREAAKLPQIAKRLSHVGAQQLPERIPMRRPFPGKAQPQDTLNYQNGPVNGLCDIQNCDVDAWTVNFGYAVTDSFSGSGTVNSLTFAFWLIPGDNVSRLQWSIGSAPYASDLGQGFSSNLTSQYLSTNSFGYDVYAVTLSGLNVNVYSGAWITLQNAELPSGDPLYWDENNGPSQAQESTIGTIPSESFNVDSGGGGGGWVCVQGGPLTYIHTFQPEEMRSSPEGSSIAINQANTVFVTSTGGAYSMGLISQLVQEEQNWVFTELNSFAGQNGGSFPWVGRFGPNGVLYGYASGGSNNGDVVFGLRPFSTACRSGSCGWTEDVVHAFGGGNDGEYVVGLAVDSAGNVYGTTSEGGLYGYGVVYEMTSQNGVWTEHILYNFTNGDDGAYPGSLLIGADGNLYGIASNGALGYGLVYKLVNSGGSWSPQIIHLFTNQGDGAYPIWLRQDPYGNMYGATSVHYSFGYLPEQIFMLAPSGGTWTFSQIWSTPYEYQYIGGLTVDREGNLYGVASNGGEVDYGESTYEFFKRTQDGQFHVSGGGGYFPANSGVAVDSAGNLYGPALFCGSNELGVVWRFSGFPDR